MPIFRTRVFYPAIFLLFLISGFCGLLYQIIWVRLAFAAFGIITPIISVVISVFMLGLALGSWAGGKYIETLSSRTGWPILVFYSLIELLIGIGGLLVPTLFRSGQTLLLSAGNSNSFSYLVLSAVILGISILPWCVCMGATIPCMMAFIKRSDQNNTTGFSYLYLANVIGAMCGTIATAVFLIELLGFRHTLLIAASLNFSIAVAGLILSSRYSSGKLASRANEAASKQDIPGNLSCANNYLVISILFITGFTSMAMEVVWTRAFTPILQTSIYSFAAILLVYLLATALGSWFYRNDASRHKVASIPRLITQLLFFCFIPIVFNDPRILWFLLYKNSNIIAIVVVLSTIFPFCATLGYLTPKLVDEISGGDSKIAGRAYAINAAGCILGPLFAGYLILPLAGVRISLLALSAPLAVYFIYYFPQPWQGFKRKITIGILIIALFAGSAKFLLSFEDPGLYDQGKVRRDYAATVISFGTGMDRALLVNGIGMTYLTPVTKSMAHLSLAIHNRKPESILIICLGMGTTFRSAASWGIKTTAVELIPSVRDAFGFYFPDTDDILKKPGNKIIIDDGRRFLRRTLEQFDAITIDPPPPVETEGSGLLYSEEFYRILKTRLKEGGILQQWFPGGEKELVQAVAKSIQSEFPYVRVFHSLEGYGYHFFASMQPFAMPNAEAFAARLPAAAKADFVEWNVDASPQQLYQAIVQKEIPLKAIVTPDVKISVTDDRPFNEYFLMRRLWNNFFPNRTESESWPL